jgi:hypothetical protein
VSWAGLEVVTVAVGTCSVQPATITVTIIATIKLTSFFESFNLQLKNKKLHSGAPWIAIIQQHKFYPYFRYAASILPVK